MSDMTMRFCLLPGERMIVAYCFEDRSFLNPSGRVRDARHVYDIIRELSDPSEQSEDRLIRDGRPPKDAVAWFDLYVRVSNTKRGFSDYSFDRKRYDGCPAAVSTVAMDVLADIKRAVRKARKDGKGK